MHVTENVGFLFCSFQYYLTKTSHVFKIVIRILCVWKGPGHSSGVVPLSLLTLQFCPTHTFTMQQQVCEQTDNENQRCYAHDSHMILQSPEGYFLPPDSDKTIHPPCSQGVEPPPPQRYARRSYPLNLTQLSSLWLFVNSKDYIHPIKPMVSQGLLCSTVTNQIAFHQRNSKSVSIFEHVMDHVAARHWFPNLKAKKASFYLTD